MQHPANCIKGMRATEFSSLPSILEGGGLICGEVTSASSKSITCAAWRSDTGLGAQGYGAILGILEKKMETIVIGLYQDLYRVFRT